MNGSSSDQKRRKVDSVGAEPPNFSSDFRNIESFEGKSIRFEAKLSPANDPQMQIDWYFNGQPIVMGKNSIRYKALVPRKLVFEMLFIS